MHDPRVGKFFAVDPLFRQFPWNSPYAFAENRVINSMEFEGQETIVVITSPYTRDAIMQKYYDTGDIKNAISASLNSVHSKFESEAAAKWAREDGPYSFDVGQEAGDPGGHLFSEEDWGAGKGVIVYSYIEDAEGNLSSVKLFSVLPDEKGETTPKKKNWIVRAVVAVEEWINKIPTQEDDPLQGDSKTVREEGITFTITDNDDYRVKRGLTRNTVGRKTITVSADELMAIGSSKNIIAGSPKNIIDKVDRASNAAEKVVDAWDSTNAEKNKDTTIIVKRSILNRSNDTYEVFEYSEQVKTKKGKVEDILKKQQEEKDSVQELVKQKNNNGG